MSQHAVSIPLDNDGRTVDPAQLLVLLRDADGVDIEIDADNTSILTSRHLQILVAAERRSQDTGKSFEIHNRSEQFDACLELLGWQPNA